MSGGGENRIGVERSKRLRPRATSLESATPGAADASWPPPSLLGVPRRGRARAPAGERARRRSLATAHRRSRRRPKQNAMLDGRLLPNRRPTDAVLVQYCSVSGAGPHVYVRTVQHMTRGTGSGVLDSGFGMRRLDYSACRNSWSPQPFPTLLVTNSSAVKCCVLTTAVSPMRRGRRAYQGELPSKQCNAQARSREKPGFLSPERSTTSRCPRVTGDHRAANTSAPRMCRNIRQLKSAGGGGETSGVEEIVREENATDRTTNGGEWRTGRPCTHGVDGRWAEGRGGEGGSMWRERWWWHLANDDIHRVNNTWTLADWEGQVEDCVRFQGERTSYDCFNAVMQGNGRLSRTWSYMLLKRPPNRIQYFMSWVKPRSKHLTISITQHVKPPIEVIVPKRPLQYSNHPTRTTEIRAERIDFLFGLLLQTVQQADSCSHVSEHAVLLGALWGRRLQRRQSCRTATCGTVSHASAPAVGDKPDVTGLANRVGLCRVCPPSDRGRGQENGVCGLTTLSLRGGRSLQTERALGGRAPVLDQIRSGLFHMTILSPPLKALGLSAGRTLMAGIHESTT